MPQAGDLRERVTFSKRAEIDDDHGNVEGAWEDQFSRAAMFIMRPGSEAVLQARLEGRQPLTIVVRYDSKTRDIAPDWRATDARTGRVYAIRAAEDMDRKRQWISIVAEAGAAP